MKKETIIEKEKDVKEIEKIAKTEHWQYPVNYIKVTNGLHQGKCIDLGWNSSVGGPDNEPVYAVFSGTIIYNQWQSTGGNVVYIQHSTGIKASYGHLKQSLVTVGQYVTQGQQIGIMGSTGSAATGVHLHFGLYSASLSNYLNNSDLNPFSYLYVHTNFQTVAAATLNSYGNSLLYYPETYGYKYVYNVDDEGLVVRSSAGGASTGQLLETGTRVEVIATSGNWSKIGEGKWVYSNNLSNTCPTFYTVTASDGLNVRNQPSTSGTLLNTLAYGRRVQIYSVSGSWAKVSPNESRWCSKNYLTLGN